MMEPLEIELHMERTARLKGWGIQPDNKKYKSLIKSMSKKARGKYIICPCKIFIDGFGDLASVRCPCGEAGDDIEVNGSCHCGMFVKRD